MFYFYYNNIQGYKNTYNLQTIKIKTYYYFKNYSTKTHTQLEKLNSPLINNSAQANFNFLQ